MFLLLEHMKRDENVKVAIWTGSGRAFNSGADLTFNPTTYVPEHIQEQYLARNMGPIPGDWVLTNDTLAFWDFPKPSIVAVNGLAVGGAANIALMNYHDLVVCSTKARFMWPFAKLGFSPELGSSVMFPQMVGMAKAKELLYLGDWVTAEQAKELGFANKVVAPEKLMEEAMKLAERLVLLPPESLYRSKQVLHARFRKDLQEALRLEQEHFVKSFDATGGPMQTKQWMKEKTEWLEAVKAKL